METEYSIDRTPRTPVAYALLVRALVVGALTHLREGRPAQPVEDTVLRAALWRAACDGVSGQALTLPFPGPYRSVPVPDGQPVSERTLASAPDATVRIVSLRGVDAAHLILADVDLSGCLFTGTVHLDQVWLEGVCPFDTSPSGTHWPGSRCGSPSAAYWPKNVSGAHASRQRPGAGTSRGLAPDRWQKASRAVQVV